MQTKALLSPVLLGACLNVGCGAPESVDEVGQALREADDDADHDYTIGERLDRSPYLVDREIVDETLIESLDLSELELEKAPTVFIETYDEYAIAALIDPETGEMLAEAEAYTEFEEDGGGIRRISTLKLNEELLKVDIEVQFQVDPRLRLLLCDEVVWNRNDAGAGSLRQAVADVRNGGSVCFDPIEFETKTPLVLHSEILVAKNISFLGSTAGGVVIHSDGSERVFNLGAATDTVMRELSLAKGEANEGGLIKNRGTLSMRECATDDGDAQRGGAIFSDGGIVFLWDSVMETSEADQGGAVYCDDCRLYVDDTRVAGHTAGAGGAFYSDRGTVVIRNGSIVTQNYADEGGGLYAHSPGGVTGVLEIHGASYHYNLAQRGAGVFMEGGRLSVAADPFSSFPGAALSGNHAFQHGGGVYVDGGFVDVASSGSIRGNMSGSHGAGIYNAGQVSVVGQGEISNNEASGRGAGIYNIGSVDLYGTARIKDNQTDTDGGGVYNAGTMIHWDHGVRVMGNHARGRGGGIYNTDATNLQALVQMQVVNNTDDDPNTSNGNVYNAP